MRILLHSVKVCVCVFVIAMIVGLIISKIFSYFLFIFQIPCKHVFCLSCARADHTHCPRCREKVLRVEQTGLGTVFMCTHSGTRYGNTGCRRTYLSQVYICIFDTIHGKYCVCIIII